MAVGVKGNDGASETRRGRSYGLMLILAFGVAVMGVLAIHKLRDRRIFNLIAEEDRRLVSLQLLIQKERQSGKDKRRKIEDLRAKVQSLKTQKMELHSRIMEMQSRMASLKDEKKTLERAFDEKQNEIETLKEREADSIKESPELISLKEVLKQREAEIEDLKQHLQSPPINVWSVRVDDPSDPHVTSTAKESMEWEDTTKSMVDQEQNDQNGQISTGEAKLQEFQNAEADYRDGGEKSTNGEQGNEEHGTEAISESEAGKSIEEDGNMKVADNEEQGNTNDGQPEKPNTSQDGERQKLGLLPEAEVKMELPGGSMNDGDAGSGVESKHGNAGKAKEKRWRILDKIREGENIGNSGYNRAATSRKRKSSNGKRNEWHSTDTTIQKIGRKHATSLENGSSGMEKHSPDVIMPTSRSGSRDNNITDRDTGSSSNQRKEVGEQRTWEAGENQQEMGTRGASKQGKEVGGERTWEAGENPQDMGNRVDSTQGKEVREEKTWEAGENQQDMDIRVGGKHGKEVGEERTWEAGENQQAMGTRVGGKQGKEVGEETIWEAGENQHEMGTRDIHEITTENAETDK